MITVYWIISPYLSEKALVKLKNNFLGVAGATLGLAFFGVADEAVMPSL